MFLRYHRLVEEFVDLKEGLPHQGLSYEQRQSAKNLVTMLSSFTEDMMSIDINERVKHAMAANKRLAELKRSILAKQYSMQIFEFSHGRLFYHLVQAVNRRFYRVSSLWIYSIYIPQSRYTGQEPADFPDMQGYELININGKMHDQALDVRMLVGNYVSIYEGDKLNDSPIAQSY
jgi:hypothetical protein